jgi:hypothetical protein
VITVVCGAVAGTLLTITDVGLDIYKYVNGDQSLSDTLLHLGTDALETLAFNGLAKLIGAGFRAAKELYTLSKAAEKATADLEAANKALWKLKVATCLLGGAAGAASRVRPAVAHAAAEGSGGCELTRYMNNVDAQGLMASIDDDGIM